MVGPGSPAQAAWFRPPPCIHPWWRALGAHGRLLRK